MPGRWSAWIGGFAMAFASACTPIDATPRPASVVPAWGFNGEDTPVLVIGEDFLPALDVSAGGSAGRDTTFAVSLTDGSRAFELTAVTWRDRTELGAIVPAGLPVGDYDVQVVDPNGRSGLLTGAFEVRDTRVDAIRMEADRVVQEVFQDAIISLALVDPSGRPVSQDLDVALRFTDDDGAPAALSWDAVDLEAVRVRSDGLDASMGDDGVGTLRVRAQEPGRVTVTATSLDDDGRVRGDDVVLQFTRGSELVADVSLPEPGFRATVDEPFEVEITLRDAFGNLADDAVVDLIVAESCGGFREPVQVRGQTSVEVRVQRASDRPGCQRNQVEVSGIVSGASEPFGVDPGPAAELFVVASDTEIIAGEPLNVTVVAYDAFGNIRGYAGRIVQVTDGSEPPADVACAAQGGGGFVSCSILLTRAGEARVLTLVDDDGLQGSSDSYVVLAASPAAIIIEPALTAWTAGEPVSVTLGEVDAYGNPIGAPDPGTTSLSDDQGLSTCVHQADGVWICRREQAGSEVRLVASRGPISGERTVVVENAPAAQIGLAVGASEVAAGDPLGVVVSIRDAYGNPWRVQESPPTVSLSPSLGQITPETVQVDGQGQATRTVTLTRAGLVTLKARHLASGIESDATVQVNGGQPTALRIDTPAPWARTGVPTTVRVEVEDAFGNRAASSGSATVRSLTSGFAPVGLSIVNGVGAATVSWSTAVGLETVEAEGLSGLTSRKELLVYRPCGSGPLGRLQVQGDAFDRSCVVDGEALAEGDLGGSAPFGSATLAHFAVSGPGGDAVDQQPVLPLSAAAPGVYTVRGLVMQDDGCATEVQDTWYVASEPGVPVGTVSMEPAAGTVDLLDATPEVLVDIAGVGDCLGDPVAGGALRVWTDRGTLSGVNPSGSGLRVVTDGAGTAQVALDFSQALAGGDALVRVQGPTAVRGSAMVAVTGDLQPPEVRDQDPKGGIETIVSTIRLTFSEPMAPATMVPAAFSVGGASPATVISVLPVTPSVVDLVLDPALSPGSGSWFVRVQPSVTDLAGNALAGTWDGPGVAYEGRFGVDAEVAPVDVCVPSTPSFRPDGDDGEGQEADAVVVDLESAATPAWWVASVRAATGALVRRTWLVPDGRVDSWAWDGRDDGERVVAPGTYTVAIDAEGTEGSRGGECSTTVTVLP